LDDFEDGDDTEEEEEGFHREKYFQFFLVTGVNAINQARQIFFCGPGCKVFYDLQPNLLLL
jgi:hypothetical protein